MNILSNTFDNWTERTEAGSVNLAGKILHVDKASQGGRCWYQFFIPINEGDYVESSVLAKATSGQNAQISIDFFEGEYPFNDNEPDTKTETETVVIDSDTYKRYQVKATAPEGAKSARILVGFWNGSEFYGDLYAQEPKITVNSSIETAFIKQTNYKSFSPELVGLSTEGEITYTSKNNCAYSLIGNIVFFQMRVDFSGYTTQPVGHLEIKGLPFNSVSNVHSTISVSAIRGFTLPADREHIGATVREGTPYIRIETPYASNLWLQGSAVNNETSYIILGGFYPAEFK